MTVLGTIILTSLFTLLSEDRDSACVNDDKFNLAIKFCSKLFLLLRIHFLLLLIPFTQLPKNYTPFPIPTLDLILPFYFFLPFQPSHNKNLILLRAPAQPLNAPPTVL